MIRYLLHLKTEYYQPAPKEKVASVEAGIQANSQAAQKAFGAAIKEHSALFSLVQQEYRGPTLTTAVLVDIEEKQLDEALAIFRLMDEVDIMEPHWDAPSPPPEKPAKKDMAEFLK